MRKNPCREIDKVETIFNQELTARGIKLSASAEFELWKKFARHVCPVEPADRWQNVPNGPKFIPELVATFKWPI